MKSLRVVILGAVLSIVGTAIDERDFLSAPAGVVSPETVSAVEELSVSRVDLGTLGGLFSQAIAVNDVGQVIGNSQTSAGQNHAFLWTSDSGMIDLGTLGGEYSYAVDINNRGQVVGNSETAGGEQHAFSWTQAGGMIDLGTLDGNSSSAADVNETGQVVGRSARASLGQEAFLWTEAGGMIAIAAPGWHSLAAIAVNDSGLLVGNGQISGAFYARPVPFYWTSETGLIGIENLYGWVAGVNNNGQVAWNAYSSSPYIWTRLAGSQWLEISQAEGWAINNEGRIVGRRFVEDYLTNTVSHLAFSWTAGEGTIDLGTLGGNFTYTTALNDTGQVVGWGFVDSATAHAFSWTAGEGMIDLGTLGGTYSQAADVNESGQIVGDSSTAEEMTHATLWSVSTAPPPPPPTDSDGDGAPDSSDNCDGIPNPSQLDTDDDDIGDACDTPPSPPIGTKKVPDRDLVLVQGNNSDATCSGWNAWVPEFLNSGAGRFVTNQVRIGQILRFNYKGGGYTCDFGPLPTYNGADTCSGIADAAAKLKELIDQRATAKVTILGHSQGGLVAAYLVAANEKWARTHIASVMTFDSPLRGAPDFNLRVLAAFGACGFADQSMQDMRHGSSVVTTLKGAAKVVPFYSLDATQTDLVPPQPLEAVPRDTAFLDGTRPLHLIARCHGKKTDPFRCEPPTPVDDDHVSVWNQRFDDSGVDKGVFVGCAIILASDCTFLSSP